MKRGEVQTTRSSWLGRVLMGGADGVARANAYIMEVYRDPLSSYAARGPFSWLGQGDELADGFFADRLDRPEYLFEWLGSGRRLRKWLLTGFRHYLLEQTRQARRASSVGRIPDEHAGGGDRPDEAYDRAVAVAIVREAFRHAEADCAVDGLGEHWSVFRRHHIDGQSYATIAESVDGDERRAAVMARTAAVRFKRILRERLAWGEIDGEEIDSEIKGLLDVLSHAK